MSISVHILGSTWISSVGCIDVWRSGNTADRECSLLLLFGYVFVVEVVQIVEGEGKPSMQQLGEWLSVVKQEVAALRLSSMRER